MTWRSLPDLAVRTRGGSVIAASDETFGERENLIRPEPPTFQPRTFGHHGQVMDGWETRRRRESGDDWVIVRLGVPGVVRGVVVDTSWFTGNYPPEVSLDATWLDPLASEAPDVEWVEVVPRSPVSGDTENTFEIDHDRLVTHIRLRQYPDGGIARLRVHGEPFGDPRWVAGRAFDLAAMEHGARILDCSNRFYSAPDNLLAPGPVRVMGEGWETRRRRDTGNDWVTIRLAALGVIAAVEIDTTYFIGNAPGWASVTGHGTDGDQDGDQVVLLPRSRLLPDTPNRFVLAAAPPEQAVTSRGSGTTTSRGGGTKPAADPRAGAATATPVRELRIDIFPDGGLARVRAWGTPTATGRAVMFLEWFNRLPAAAAASVLVGWGGADHAWATGLADGRPYTDPDQVLAAAAASPGRAPEPATWNGLFGYG